MLLKVKLLNFLLDKNINVFLNIILYIFKSLLKWSHQIDPPWLTHSSQCSTTGVTGHGMCCLVWDGAYKRTLVANQKE